MIAALVEAPQFTVAGDVPKRRGRPLVVIAAGLQDPGNLGTLVRSAEAFGATGMILLPGTVSLWNAKTLRASSGSAFRLPVVTLTAEDAFAALRDHGVRIFAAVARDGDSEADLRGPSALLVGNEGSGLPDAWIAQADARVTDSPSRRGGKPERGRSRAACCCTTPCASVKGETIDQGRT